MEFIDELRFLKEQLKFNEKVEVPEGTDSVVIAGMGGSGIAGKIFSEFYSDKPVTLVDDYKLPRFVSRSTLVIAISYSGNTEETVGLAWQARARKAHVVTISAGTRLHEYGDQKIIVPRRDLQPRSATGYMLLPLLYGFGVATKKEIRASARLMEGLDRDNRQCLSDARNAAVGNRIPVIYGSSPFKSVAYRWKTQLNEVAKVIAYSNSFPELNHNDTVALAQTYRKRDFCFYVFGTNDARISKRISVTSRITNSRFRIVHPKGGTDIERMFYLFHYGDYLSYHLGAIRKVDPADVSMIEKLKKSIKEG
jgi:glucose/mannose-6-phosphate isomerase